MGNLGHSFPQLFSQEQIDELVDDEGRVTLTCAGCKATYSITPNFVAEDGTLRRKLHHADDAVYEPCKATAKA